MTKKIDFGIFELDRDQIDEVKWGAPPGFKSVTSSVITEEHRWFNVKEQVFEHRETETFWEFNWCESTADDGDLPEDLEAVTMTQVEPYEVMVTKYREVK